MARKVNFQTINSIFEDLRVASEAWSRIRKELRKNHLCSSANIKSLDKLQSALVEMLACSIPPIHNGKFLSSKEVADMGKVLRKAAATAEMQDMMNQEGA